MRKNALLFSFLVSLIFIMGCVTEETFDPQVNCTDIDYKVVLIVQEPRDKTERTIRTLELRTPNDSAFTENLTVIVGNDNSNPILISEEDSSPKFLSDLSNMDEGTVPSVQILSDGCPEEDAIKKDEADITADTDEASCDSGIVAIEEIRCTDEYTFNWEAGTGQDLIGYSFEIYGKEIDLGADTTVTFPISDLDLNAGIGELVINVNAAIGSPVVVEKRCIFTNLSTTICTGTTGTLELTDPIEGGDDLIVTVMDADLTDSGDFTLTVVTNLEESESVTLAETDDGVFVGTLATALSNTKGDDNDGSLNIEKDVTISVTYDDEFDDEGNDPDPFTETVTVAGELAPMPPMEPIEPIEPIPVVVGEVTYNGITYTVGDATFFQLGSIVFSLAEDTDMPAFFADISLESSTTLSSGTYTIGASDFFVVTNESSVTVGDQAGTGVAFTSGSVELTVESDRYILEINLSTAESTLTGTVEAPFP